MVHSERKQHQHGDCTRSYLWFSEMHAVSSAMQAALLPALHCTGLLHLGIKYNRICWVSSNKEESTWGAAKSLVKSTKFVAYGPPFVDLCASLTSTSHTKILAGQLPSVACQVWHSNRDQRSVISVQAIKRVRQAQLPYE